jgi:hypothetical protein
MKFLQRFCKSAKICGITTQNIEFLSNQFYAKISRQLQTEKSTKICLMFIFISHLLAHVLQTTNIRKGLKGTSVSGSFMKETLHENYNLIQVSAVWNDLNCKRNMA